MLGILYGDYSKDFAKQLLLDKYKDFMSWKSISSNYNIDKDLQYLVKELIKQDMKSVIEGGV